MIVDIVVIAFGVAGGILMAEAVTAVFAARLWSAIRSWWKEIGA